MAEITRPGDRNRVFIGTDTPAGRYTDEQCWALVLEAHVRGERDLPAYARLSLERWVSPATRAWAKALPSSVHAVRQT